MPILKTVCLSMLISFMLIKTFVYFRYFYMVGPNLVSLIERGCNRRGVHIGQFLIEGGANRRGVFISASFQ